MKIFVLGNGFDLACGWKSKFSDYFEHLYKQTEFSKTNDFSLWFDTILNDAKKYLKQERFFLILFSHLIEPFLPHKEFVKPKNKDVENFVKSDKMFQIFCLIFEINNYLNDNHNNEFKIRKINWLNIENNIKKFSSLNNKNESCLAILVSKIIESVESTMLFLKSENQQNSQCYDNCEWLLNDIFQLYFNKEDLINLLTKWIESYQDNFAIFLYEQQYSNLACNRNILPDSQAQKYNNLFKYVDNIKDGETIKIVNFNYTYQYFHKSIADDKNQILINNLLEKNENYITHNKHLNFLPISYIHGEAVGNRQNDNSLPRCIIGFNENNKNINSNIQPLTKTFKINHYIGGLNMGMFPDEYYKISLPDLHSQEHLDIIFFGHSLGENDWPYFFDIFDRYNIKTYTNFKIYFLFDRYIHQDNSDKIENTKKIINIFDCYLNKNSYNWISEYVVKDDENFLI